MILKLRLNLRTAPKPNAEDQGNTEAGKKRGTYASDKGSAVPNSSVWRQMTKLNQ